MRIGIFGGTFDPIHLGHLILAEQCRVQANLDEVWFVPSYTPPHKLENGVTRLSSAATCSNSLSPDTRRSQSTALRRNCRSQAIQHARSKNYKRDPPLTSSTSLLVRITPRLAELV